MTVVAELTARRAATPFRMDMSETLDGGIGQRVAKARTISASSSRANRSTHAPRLGAPFESKGSTQRENPLYPP